MSDFESEGGSSTLPAAIKILKFFRKSIYELDIIFYIHLQTKDLLSEVDPQIENSAFLLGQ